MIEIEAPVRIVSGVWEGLVGIVYKRDSEGRIHVIYDKPDDCDSPYTYVMICNPSELELIEEAGE